MARLSGPVRRGATSPVNFENPLSAEVGRAIRENGGPGPPDALPATGPLARASIPVSITAPCSSQEDFYEPLALDNSGAQEYSSSELS